MFCSRSSRAPCTGESDAAEAPDRSPRESEVWARSEIALRWPLCIPTFGLMSYAWHVACLPEARCLRNNLIRVVHFSSTTVVSYSVEHRKTHIFRGS